VRLYQRTNLTLLKMDAFLPIHLPWFITLHAFGLLALGLYLLFTTPPPGKPAGHTPQLGIATVAIGLAYLFTAYMPIEENQWLHASVPVRLILGVLLSLRVLLGTGLTAAEKKTLSNLGLYDSFGALVLGFWLGRFDGRLPSLSS
jgi:hypothetical protein